MGFEAQSTLAINGTINAVLIDDPGGAPVTIIKDTTPFTVKLSWNINGSALSVMDGTFNAMAFFEHIGVDAVGGPEDAQFASAPVAFTSGTPVGAGLSKDYNTDIAVPAGALKPGAYDMVCLLTFTNTLGLPGNLSANTDEVVVQIYEPHPSLP